VSEARVESGIPVTAGWFVINARNARWLHNDMRVVCRFGGQGEAHFDDLGIGLYWLEPGKPMSLYHHEAGQEDFFSCAANASSSSRATSAGSWRGTSSIAHPRRRTRSSQPAPNPPSFWLWARARRREAPAIHSTRLLFAMALACRTHSPPRGRSMPGSVNLIQAPRQRSSRQTSRTCAMGLCRPPAVALLERGPNFRGRSTDFRLHGAIRQERLSDDGADGLDYGQQSSAPFG
jgi:hypothetical protein